MFGQFFIRVKLTQSFTCQTGEEGLAGRGCVRGKAGARFNHITHRMAAVYGIENDHVLTVQHADPCGVAGLFGQPGGARMHRLQKTTATIKRAQACGQLAGAIAPGCGVLLDQSTVAKGV